MSSQESSTLPEATLPERLAAGEALSAAWIALDSATGAEAVAASGVDVVVLDMQHGLTHAGNLHTMLQAAQGAGAPTMVRVAANDSTEITRALDLGADGVIVPLVSDASEAAAAVAPCRYPPDGNRSYGPLRAAIRYGNANAAERAAAVFVMIETRTGLEQVEAIAATPGLTGLFIGPADLGLSLGLGTQTDGSHPEHRHALERILAACRDHGIACGIYSNDPAYGLGLVERGMQLVVIASDASLLQQGVSERVSQWRSGLAGNPGELTAR